MGTKDPDELAFEVGVRGLAIAAACGWCKSQIQCAKMCELNLPFSLPSRSVCEGSPSLQPAVGVSPNTEHKGDLKLTFAFPFPLALFL